MSHSSRSEASSFGNGLYQTLFNDILCAHLLHSHRLAQSRNDLEHAIGNRSVHAHADELLMKVDAVDENFAAGHAEKGAPIGNFATEAAAAKIKLQSGVKQLGAFDEFRICNCDGVDSLGAAFFAAAAKQGAAACWL